MQNIDLTYIKATQFYIDMGSVFSEIILQKSMTFLPGLLLLFEKAMIFYT